MLCFKADYYTPGMIFYCRPQMRWACSCLPLLDDCTWPPDPHSTAIDPAIKSKHVKIPSKVAQELAIEIDVRLETCKKDGKDLVDLLINNGPDVILTERADDVLNYISGWRRRRQSYGQWKADRWYKSRKSDKKYRILVKT